MSQRRAFKWCRKKSFLLAVGAAVFVFAGILAEFHLIGIGFFGLGLLVFVARFFSNAEPLVLDDVGIEYKSYFSNHYIQWRDVRSIYIRRFKYGRVIAVQCEGKTIHFANVYDAPLREVKACLEEWHQRYVVCP